MDYLNVYTLQNFIEVGDNNIAFEELLASVENLKGRNAVLLEMQRRLIFVTFWVHKLSKSSRESEKYSFDVGFVQSNLMFYTM